MVKTSFSKEIMTMDNAHVAKATALIMLAIGFYVLIDAETMGSDQKKKAETLAYIVIASGVLYLLWSIMAWIKAGGLK